MGAVNAVATLTGCLAAVIWWACHRPNRLWCAVHRAGGRWRRCSPSLWWVVALVLLGRVSPPFLDFIESSGVTTQWTSLTEVLRGTDSWTPFVAPDATAGASLVTGSVAVLATTLVAAAGLAGLAMRTMPARGRLVTMLLVGVVLLAVGYSGGLGSPLAHQVQLFLDAGGHAAAQRAQARAGDPAARWCSASPTCSAAYRYRGARHARCGCTRSRIPSTTSGWPSASSCWSRWRSGTLAGVDGAADAPRRVRRDPARTGTRRRGLARRAQCGHPPAGAGAGGAGRAVRHPGVGHQPRRAAAGARQQPVGCPRLRFRSPHRRRSARSIRCSGCSPPAVLLPGWPTPLPGKAFPTSWSATTSTRQSSRSARPLLVHRAIDGSRGLVEGGAVRRAGRTGHAGGVHHRQRAAAAVPRGRDLPGRQRGRNPGRAVPHRHRRDGPHRRRAGGAAATRRATPAAAASRRWGRCC